MLLGLFFGRAVAEVIKFGSGFADGTLNTTNRVDA